MVTSWLVHKLFLWTALSSNNLLYIICYITINIERLFYIKETFRLSRSSMQESNTLLITLMVIKLYQYLMTNYNSLLTQIP